MILEHNGKTVNWFDINFKHRARYKKIGMWLSGGADSAFTLWYLTKIISQNSFLNYSIYCLHGWDTARTENNSADTARNIVDYVINAFPNKDIDLTIDLHIFKYYMDPDDQNQSKGIFHDPEREKAKREGKCTYVINSITANAPKIWIQPERDVYNEKPWASCEPYAHVDKSFLAAQYKKFGLKDLFNLTVSCTRAGYEGHGEEPCKECDWCLEKKWAFGYYDGGWK